MSNFIVNNKLFLQFDYMKTVFDEMWYIFEYLFMNIFSFLIVFYWNKPKIIIIFINNYLTLQNFRQIPILFIGCTCMPTLYQMGYIPICLLLPHSLVCIKDNSYFLVIESLLYWKLIEIFLLWSYFSTCTRRRDQVLQDKKLFSSHLKY